MSTADHQDPYHEIGDEEVQPTTHQSYEAAPEEQPAHNEDPYHEIGDEDEQPTHDQDPYHEIGDEEVQNHHHGEVPAEEQGENEGAENSELTRQKSEAARMEAARTKAAMAARQSASRRASAASCAMPEQSPAAMDAMADMEAELRELDAEDAIIEKRFALFTEIVGLKKELAAVQEEEKLYQTRLQEARALTESGANDNVGDYIACLEQEAENSTVASIWAITVQEHPLDSMISSELSAANMESRVDTAREQLGAICAAADREYERQAEGINKRTDGRDQEKAKLKKSFEKEMRSLQQTQKRLKQMEDEQWHHIRRGTYVKERHMPMEARADLVRQSAGSKETKLCEDLNVLNNEISDTVESIKEYKRQLDDNRRDSEERLKKLVAQLNEVDESGKETRELKATLEAESTELKNIKADLQNVLQYVRIRNKNMD